MIYNNEHVIQPPFFADPARLQLPNFRILTCRNADGPPTHRRTVEDLTLFFCRCQKAFWVADFH